LSAAPQLEVAIAASMREPSDADFVVDAERLGVSTVYIAEAWGTDALTPLAYLAARTTTIRLATGIIQIGARTPAMLAMSAMTMQGLSGGRFILGLGTSGPQIMEGWHGVRFRSPIQATRETIEIVRQVARGERLSHQGTVYQLPLPESAGRSIRSMLPPVDVPITIAALGPRNLELTGELANGWIGNAFLPEHAEAFLSHLRDGAARSGRSISEIELVIPVSLEFTDNVDEAARRHADGYAFTIGAMGSPKQNFYNAAFERQGFGDDVAAVQALWLDGKREEAAARVPIEIGMHTNLLGTPSTVKERLRKYRAAGINTLQAKIPGKSSAQLDAIAQLIDIVGEVNREIITNPND
jgi:F420-dependent oxidoreductase-like protein